VTSDYGCAHTKASKTTVYYQLYPYNTYQNSTIMVKQQKSSMKQQQQQAAAAQLILQAQERAVSEEIVRCDQVLDDDAALEQLRAQRLRQLQQQAQQQQQYRQAGHGTYQELGDGCASKQDARDVGRAFFEAAKASERLVVHFYRPCTEYCEVFHKHLEQLAASHLETKFVKLNVQDCDTVAQSGAAFLVERLKVTVMPTLVLICGRQAVHQVRGFDELGGTAEFSQNRLAQVLAAHGVLELRESEQRALRESSNRSRKNSSGVNSIRVKSGGRRGIYNTEEDEDHEDF